MYRLIKASTRLKLSLNELVKMCADHFNSIIKENGFANFKELRESYDWEASDIRDELNDVVNESSNWWMSDDGIFLADDDSDEEISYGNFKKQVFKLVK